MKKLVLGIHLLLQFFAMYASGQSPAFLERTRLFCKVWGFLKYYHPSVAAGRFDWDSVFLENIQSVREVTSNAGFNVILDDMIVSAGPVESRKEKKMPDSLFLLNQVTVEWFNRSTVLSGPVKEKLRFIAANKNHGENKYIKVDHLTADYSGENTYEGISFPDENHRLLFLSRFWNIIYYFAPYKFLASPWDAVLKTFIPKIILAQDSISYYKNLQELCKSLKDGHSQVTLNDHQSLTDLIFGKYMVPFYCVIIDGNVVIRKINNDSVARASNLQVGDIVLRLDNQDIHGIIEARRKYISASNTSDEMHQLSRFVLDGQTPAAQLLIKRGNRTIKCNITRIPTSQRDWGALINYTYNDLGYKKLNESVLLIYAMQIWKGTIDTMKQLIRGSRVVIFDVRNYPQNDEFYSIVDPFLKKPQTIDYTTVLIPDDPGLFKWRINENRVGHDNDRPFNGKVLILADERTQSQGEYSCMVLQTIPGAVTIGRQTGGADGVLTPIPICGGLTMSYSGYGVYYPDKRQTQGKGIKIDIPVKRTIAGILQGNDEILEKALQYIDR